MRFIYFITSLIIIEVQIVCHHNIRMYLPLLTFKIDINIWWMREETCVKKYKYKQRDMLVKTAERRECSILAKNRDFAKDVSTKPASRRPSGRRWLSSSSFSTSGRTSTRDVFTRPSVIPGSHGGRWEVSWPPGCFPPIAHTESGWERKGNVKLRRRSGENHDGFVGFGHCSNTQRFR